MILGFAVFRMDPKKGPEKIYQSESIEKISHQEILAIFATHNLFAHGFRGVHTGTRTWATYVHPPWIIALLLSADEPIEPIGTPMTKALHQARLEDSPTPEQWEGLFQAIQHEVKSSPVADLLTSRRTIAFLKNLLDMGLTELNPRFSFAIGITYPAAEQLTGINSYDTRIFLEKLTLAGIFTSEPVGGITHCPVCSGFKIASRIACPECSVTALEIVRTNLPSIAAEVEETNSDSLPKAYYSCLTCHHLTQNPIMTLVCTECGSQFKHSEAHYQTMNRLVLDKSTAKSLIRETERGASLRS